MKKQKSKPPRKPSKAEIKFWNEPEWTFKNTLKRVVGYGFTALLLWACLSITADGFNRKGVGALIGGLILTVGWIYIDLKIIIEKYKRGKAARQSDNPLHRQENGFG